MKVNEVFSPHLEPCFSHINGQIMYTCVLTDDTDEIRFHVLNSGDSTVIVIKMTRGRV